MFLYSQDLSNRKTFACIRIRTALFLYSQDLSNRKTTFDNFKADTPFLYSQDLSNRKTFPESGRLCSCFCTLKI